VAGIHPKGTQDGFPIKDVGNDAHADGNGYPIHDVGNAAMGKDSRHNCCCLTYGKGADPDGMVFNCHHASSLEGRFELRQGIGEDGIHVLNPC